ncbi:MAG: TIGR04423 family type III CRISPR-associated protein [Bacteroidota bacterium]
MHQAYKKLTDIPSRKYEGYIWFSNEITPVVLRKQTYDFAQVQVNPFIVEAQLYCVATNTSVLIKHSGTYAIHEFALGQLPNEVVLEENPYLAHRIEGVNKLKFAQLWKPEADPNCEGMEVLTMQALIFAGFDH